VASPGQSAASWQDADLPERVLVVHCPRWPLRALGLSEDEPVAVVAGGVVVSASLAAGTEGVRVGLGQREAQLRCAELALHARDEAAERRAFEPVVVALESFGVPVTLRSPGWAALPVRPLARRLGGEAGVVAALEEVLGGLRLPFAEALEKVGKARWWRIGIADGFFAASLAAARGRVVERGEAASFLAPLPIEHLGDEALAEVLRHLGIETLGAFAALDPDAVSSRFGIEGARLHALAAGRQGTLGPARRPGALEQAEMALDPPSAHLEAALFVARGLADELNSSLARRGLVCRLLAIQVSLANGTCLERRWSGRGSCDPTLVAERLRAQLEQLAASLERTKEESEEPLGLEVAAVRLVALEVAGDKGEQRSLWSCRLADDDQVIRVAARLEGLLGPRAVLRASSGGGRGPLERARLHGFDEVPPPEASLPGLVAPWPGRLPSPSPAVVPAVGPQVEVFDEHGAPVTIDARGGLSASPVRVVVTPGAPPLEVWAWAGPFPVDERWWEGPSRRRRRARLQVVLVGGAAYLLVLERGRWSIEGCYD
jgi:protein ImuB